MTNVDILYEDSSILVCVKPAGIPVQTKSIGTHDLESILKNHLAQNKASGKSKNRAPYLAVIHRLDQPVRGILVFAKTPSAAKKLNKQLQEQNFGKYYQAVVCGTLPSSGTLGSYLVKDGRTNTSRICTSNTPGAKYSELSYEIIQTTRTRPVLSVVKIHLKTGRHHQIRVQMAGAGAPLWGDNKYNPDFVGKKGCFPIALCAYYLQFSHPETGKNLEFQIDCDWPQMTMAQ